MRTMLLRIAGVLPLLSLLAANTHAAQPFQLEAEDAKLNGVGIFTQAPGYSGIGYIDGFDKEGDNLTWTFNAEAGRYVLMIMYRAPYGEKQFEGKLNDGAFSGMFKPTEDFTPLRLGAVYLKDGQNTLTIGGGWNWYQIDCIAFIPAPPKESGGK